MKFTVLLAAAGALLSTEVAVAAECSGSNGDLIHLTKWSAELVGGSVYALRIEFVNAGDRPFRMVDGAVYFTDPLGRSLGAFDLSPDTKLAAGASGAQEWPRIISSDGPRLATVSGDDVVAKICVDAVVYDDGTVEKFN